MNVTRLEPFVKGHQDNNKQPHQFNSAALQADTGPTPLRLTFPVDGSTVELNAREGNARLPLVASGGRRPIRWLVNGIPLKNAGQRRKAFWQPDGEGAVRVTVIDNNGATQSAAVWLSLTP